MNIFYLDWSSKRPITKFTDKIPEDINIQYNINLRGYNDLKRCYCLWKY